MWFTQPGREAEELVASTWLDAFEGRASRNEAPSTPAAALNALHVGGAFEDHAAQRHHRPPVDGGVAAGSYGTGLQGGRHAMHAAGPHPASAGLVLQHRDDHGTARSR